MLIVRRNFCIKYINSIIFLFIILFAILSYKDGLNAYGILASQCLDDFLGLRFIPLFKLATRLYCVKFELLNKQ